MDDIPEANKSPEAMHQAEQMWARANEAMDNVLARIKNLEPVMYANAGGNTDASVLFDFMKGYVKYSETQAQKMDEEIEAKGLPPLNFGQATHDATIVLAACAITRLMRQDDRMQTSTVLAELEREMTDDDDH